ncbi:MAG TPA: family 43 glycosylhydrolase [Patescibacteria group bacterium]
MNVHLRTQFANPVLNRDFPDPAILPRRVNGKYYAFATQESPHNPTIQMATSEDLITWELSPRGAFARKPIFAQHSRDYWAPHIIEDIEYNRFIMAYTVRSDSTGQLGISLAIASDLDEGFIDPHTQPLLEGPGYSIIDPHYLIDPRTGKRWLYWGSHETPIMMQELDATGLRFAVGSVPQAVLHPIPEHPVLRLLEGFFVFYHPGCNMFFGLASGPNTWEPDGYHVSCFWAKDPTGPFEPIPHDMVIVSPSQRWLAPGQCSIFCDEGNQYWLYLHAVDVQNPHNNFSNKQIARVMCAVPLDFSQGYPQTVGREVPCQAIAGPSIQTLDTQTVQIGMY